MIFSARYALAATCAFAAFSGGAQASEADFLKRFHGSFSGNGSVKMDAKSDARAISCKVSGTSTATSLNMGGTCSAGMMSKNISASLRATGNGSYSGTYNGIDGSAPVTGRRSGNTLVLSIRGQKPATMRISNTGKGFALSVVADKVQVTQVSLARTGGAQIASIAE